MIGSKYIEINWKNFVQGMTTSNNTEDGGFSIGNGSSDLNWSVINPIATPGLLSFPAATTDKSTGLTGNMIASCEDPTNAYARCYISADADSDGRFWTCPSDGTLTERGSEDATANYQFGRTDMIPWQGAIYFTTNTHIRLWELPATFDAGAYPYSFNDTSAFHPALVYEDNAYFGDGNELWRITTAAGAPSVILTLPSNQKIQALGIDPASGKMLISVMDQYDHGDTYNVQSRVLYYNGYSAKVDRVVLVDEMVTCFYNMGGTVFVAYGRNFGYWTGTGIQFLRRLNITANDSDRLLYKHHITNIGQILYIAEDSRILAFGEVMQGQGRSWWYAYLNAPNGVPANITNLVNLGSNNLTLSCTSNAPAPLFQLFNTRSTSSVSNGTFFSLKYDFPRAVTFNSILTEYSAAMTANTDTGAYYLYDDTGNATYWGAINRTTRSDLVTFENPYPTMKTRTIQLRYLAYANLPIERITIFYNDKE